jgi:hypothetical protein
MTVLSKCRFYYLKALIRRSISSDFDMGGRASLWKRPTKTCGGLARFIDASLISICEFSQNLD